MTQINEIKLNTLPNFIYAFPMSTANLHSSRKTSIPYTLCAPYVQNNDICPTMSRPLDYFRLIG